MKWNSKEEAYFGTTSDGKQIRVEGDEMAESAQDVGVDVGELSGLSHNVQITSRGWEVNPGWSLSPSEAELLDPDTWQTCIGANQNVSYV